MQSENREKIYCMEKGEQNKLKQRNLAVASGIGFMSTIGSYYVLSSDSFDTRIIMALAVLSIVFTFMFSRIRKTAQLELYDRKLIISNDAIELRSKQISKKMNFSEILNAEIWMDYQSKLLNISIVGEEKRIDIEGLENMDQIVKDIQNKTSTAIQWKEKRLWWAYIWENPFLCFLAFAGTGLVILMPYAVDIFDQRIIWGVICIALGFYSLLGRPSLRYFGKKYRTLEILCGISFLVQGLRNLWQ